MKKTVIQAALATTMLFSGVIGPVSAAGTGGSTATAKPAATPTVKPSVTATAKPTTALIMRDNLSKYGLKKTVELPVTVEAGGLSYTLEKIMIFDFNSKEAVALRKTYNYGEESGLYIHPKYFIWTKFTVKNNSKKVFETESTGEKWRLKFQGLKAVDPAYRFSSTKLNDSSAVNRMKLKPGEQLSSYQAYMYEGELEYFQIILLFNGVFAEKSIVKAN